MRPFLCCPCTNRVYILHNVFLSFFAFTRRQYVTCVYTPAGKQRLSYDCFSHFHVSKFLKTNFINYYYRIYFFFFVLNFTFIHWWVITNKICNNHVQPCVFVARIYTTHVLAVNERSLKFQGFDRFCDSTGTRDKNVVMIKITYVHFM